MLSHCNIVLNGILALGKVVDQTGMKKALIASSQQLPGVNVF